MTMDIPAKIPLRERLNVRMIVFAALVLLLVGYPVYWYLDIELTGGIKQYGDLLKVDLKALSDFPFDQARGTIEDVPARWRAIDGKRVQLRGEMVLSSDTSDKVRAFDLVYSIAKCCLSGPPQIQHFIHSRVVEGEAQYYQGLVDVVGTLRVDVVRSQGQVQGVYWLDVETVKPVR